MCRPHRKQHLSAAANAGKSKVKDHSDTDALVKRIVKRKQAAINGELVQACADLPSTFQQYDGKNGASEADALASLRFSQARGGWHIPRQYGTRGIQPADYQSQGNELGPSKQHSRGDYQPVIVRVKARCCDLHPSTEYKSEAISGFLLQLELA